MSVSGTAPQELRAIAEARGGDGGDAGAGGSGGGVAGLPGDGGDATATARAIGSATTIVSAEAAAYGGDGGYEPTSRVGGTGGSASATAHAESDSSDALASIRVEAGHAGAATAGVAGDAIVTGGVSGSSPETLYLRIYARGGWGGVAGGNARVSGDYANPGGGALDFYSSIDTSAYSTGDASAGPIFLETADPGQSVDGRVVATTRGGGDATLVDVLSTTSQGEIYFEQAADIQGAPGGEARSELTTQVDATSIEVVTSASGSTNSNGDGAPATALADVTNLAGDATARATAESGSVTQASAAAQSFGGSAATAVATTDTPSGAETADASATASGSGAVVAEARTGGGTATAIGSSGGAGSVDVVAEGAYATAHGESLTGDVHVTARNTTSALSDVRDRVSGSTAGHLVLTQHARSDANAFTALQAENPGGGSLELDVEAWASRLGTGGHAILGDIHGTSTTGEDVTVRVNAVSASAPSRGTEPGRILQFTLDGEDPYSPSTIHAESNGGTVRAVTRFQRGASAGSDDGWDLTVENVASVQTTGAVEIDQTAVGGDGSSGDVDFDGGAGGTGTSILTRADARPSLSLASRAEGGQGGLQLGGLGSEDRRGGDGGEAHALVDGSNSGGSISVLGEARGGEAPSTGGSAAHGGHAFVDVSASTSGDGHAVEVGVGDAATTGAFGGSGGEVRGNDRRPQRSHGGDATSASTGTALGDSTVTVIDRARGGDGGDSLLGQDEGFGGDGGAGSSTALAMGAGLSRVAAQSESFGGLAPEGPEVRGNGGSALADATAIGLGLVESTAVAAGGDGDRGGNARARASADGASGFARATARSSLGSNRIAVSGATTVGSAVSVTAEAGRRVALPELAMSQDVEAGLVFSAQARLVDIARATAGNAAIGSLVEGDSNIAFLGQFAAASPTGPHTTTSTFDLQLDELGALDDVTLGVFELEAAGAGFAELRLRIERAGVEVILEQVFTSLAAAEAFFADTSFGLGSLAAGDDLLIVLEADQQAGDQVGLSFALTALPEPRTGLLLVVALAVTLRRGRGPTRARRAR